MDRKTKRLVKKLSHDDPKVRYETVLALGRTGNTELIPHLDKVATLDKHTKVRKLAGKAVRTLEMLKAKEEAEARRAALEADQEDWNLEWQVLKHQVEEDARRKGKSSEWTYDSARQAEIQAAAQAEVEREKAEKAEKKAQRRARWRYRIILWLSASVATIALVPISQWVVEREEKIPLENWAEENQSVVRAFDDAFEDSELDCEMIFGQDDEESDDEADSESNADENAEDAETDTEEQEPSPPDANFNPRFRIPPPPDDYDPEDWKTFDEYMTRVRSNLSELQERSEIFCQGRLVTIEIPNQSLATSFEALINDARRDVENALTEVDTTLVDF